MLNKYLFDEHELQKALRVAVRDALLKTNPDVAINLQTVTISMEHLQPVGESMSIRIKLQAIPKEKAPE